MPEFGIPVTIHQFCQAHASEYDRTGLYHVGAGRWVGRCAAGVLLTKNGAPYLTLEEVLSDLASVEIRRIAVEWDGLAATARGSNERKPR